ncbi:hypothetical protein Nepgr_012812 [Nepenthes gracilis]|uniref:Uncharacterized protein n=1 Tax=Nepenthes gracilis TaxID=150966 RepID=A0AAD3SHS8_NEPGR|nr:hypothetical protein Nepgr_012812 [Nepenthes gracilis]
MYTPSRSIGIVIFLPVNLTLKMALVQAGTLRMDLDYTASLCLMPVVAKPVELAFFNLLHVFEIELRRLATFSFFLLGNPVYEEETEQKSVMFSFNVDDEAVDHSKVK